MMDFCVKKVTQNILKCPIGFYIYFPFNALDATPIGVFRGEKVTWKPSHFHYL